MGTIFQNLDTILFADDFNLISSGTSLTSLELKMANVVPIFKSGDTDQIGNYRPVSLLSTVSKVFKRIFYNRLLTFIKEQQILYNMQFGFREGHSTQQAIIKLLESIIDNLDNGNYAAAIFLDFSKAFDTVNHQILLQA